MYNTRDQYREAWQKAFHSDPLIPLNIDIETATACNLACPFCFWGDESFKSMMRAPQDGGTRPKFMPFKLARAILDEAGELGVPAIKFNWRGEPTLNPHFTDILKYARYLNKRYECFHDLLVNTNGNVPDRAMPGLMIATKVMISLDSMVPETYARMRPRGDLERVKLIIAELVGREHPNIWVRRVITEDNSMEHFARDVHEVFGDKVKISEHYKFERGSGVREEPGFERVYCGYPSQRMIISTDGRVFPCCVDYMESMPVGHFGRQTLAEIWNGERFRDLRKWLRGGTMPSNTCRDCMSWMAYNRPERMNVEDREVKP